MTEKTCSLCGIIFQNDGELCETCGAMMTTENMVSQPIFESNSAQPLSQENAFQPAFNQPFPSNGNLNPFQPGNEPVENFQSNYKPFPPRENNSHQYSPPPLRPVSPVIESEYKPTLWNWITELPTFAKVGVIVVIFSVCFGIALKGFMTMDVSLDPSGATAEPQKPWFSSWLRSKPTAEEIFYKYETETLAKSKNPSAQSYLLSGQGQILNGTPNGAIDIPGARKKLTSPDQKTAAPPTPAQAPPKQQTIPNLTDLNIAFEMAIKNPNMMLLKMMMKPKEGLPQTYSAFQTVGFDGSKGWGFSKTYVSGKENFKEDAFQPNGFFFSRANNGITLDFTSSMYQKMEFVAEEFLNNRRVYKVQVTDNFGEVSSLYFDIESGLLSKISRKSEDIFILEHKNINGGLYPSAIVLKVATNWVLLRVDKIEADASFDDTIFLRTHY